MIDTILIGLCLLSSVATLALLIHKEIPSIKVRKHLEITDMGIALAESMSRLREKELGHKLDGFNKAKIASQFIAETAKVPEAHARKLVEIRLSALQKASK